MNDLGLLVARLALGLSLAAHGAQKAFGWFGGPGPQAAAGFMESLGFKPGTTFAQAAYYNEMVSGLLIAVGLGGPVGPAGVVSTMAVAAESVHRKNGFFAANGGVEVNVLYTAGSVALASSGYGSLSLDHALGIDEKVQNPLVSTLALVAGIAAAYAVLAQRDTSPPDGTLAAPTIKGADRNGTNGQPSTAPSSASS